MDAARPRPRPQQWGVDLNADLGESRERWRSGLDRALLRIVTSANVCTGAYAGDDELLHATCTEAVAREVRIGAQVGYPDREGFGREPKEFEPSALADEIASQVRHLRGIVADCGGTVDYVKPHGALYHRIIADPVQATAVRAALDGLPLMCLAGTTPGGSPPDIAEGFADRGYASDGRLIPRSQTGALITEPDAAAAQAVRLLDGGVDSICVHSDSPGAGALARAVRAALGAVGAEVRHP
jgi:UPF0271 protein